MRVCDRAFSLWYGYRSRIQLGELENEPNRRMEWDFAIKLDYCIRPIQIHNMIINPYAIDFITSWFAKPHWIFRIVLDLALLLETEESNLSHHLSSLQFDLP